MGEVPQVHIQLLQKWIVQRWYLDEMVQLFTCPLILGDSVPVIEKVCDYSFPPLEIDCNKNHIDENT